MSPALAGGFFTIGKSPGKSSPRLCLHQTFVDFGILKKVLGLVSELNEHQIVRVYLLSNTEKKITH